MAACQGISTVEREARENKGTSSMSMLVSVTREGQRRCQRGCHATLRAANSLVAPRASVGVAVAIVVAEEVLSTRGLAGGLNQQRNGESDT